MAPTKTELTLLMDQAAAKWIPTHVIREIGINNAVDIRVGAHTLPESSELTLSIAGYPDHIHKAANDVFRKLHKAVRTAIIYMHTHNMLCVDPRMRQKKKNTKFDFYNACYGIRTGN